jgi:hypothetical protein
MSQPKIENHTDFLAEPRLLVDASGERACAIVKATFELKEGPPSGRDGSFELAPRDRRRPIRSADVPWGKPEISSIKYPSDLCVRKPGTDVIVVAKAYAPGGQPVPSFDAGLELGGVSKIVRVTGVRVWHREGKGLTQPRPIDALELRYDHAFGGIDTSDPAEIVEDARNPVGRGIARDPSTLERQAGPQIESPYEPITDAADRPEPMGLGAIGRHWEPRRKLWGSYGGDWVEKRAPLPPRDFDERANQCASPGLVATPPLSGGEEGALENLTPGGGTLRFVLPRIQLCLTFLPKGAEPVRTQPHLDTVLLDTIEVAPAPHVPPGAKRPWSSPLTIEMVYRASIPAPRRLGELRIHVEELRS